jgi:hypothetical protein
MTKYTVILLYPEYSTDMFGSDISVQWVNATDEQDAADKARTACVEYQECGEYGEPPGSDLKVIAMFEGHHVCVADESWEL